MSIFGKKSFPLVAEPAPAAASDTAGKPKLSFMGNEFDPPMSGSDEEAIVEVITTDYLRQPLRHTSVPLTGQKLRFVDHYLPSRRCGWVDTIVEGRTHDESERLFIRSPYVADTDTRHIVSRDNATQLCRRFYEEMAQTLVLGSSEGGRP